MSSPTPEEVAADMQAVSVQPVLAHLSDLDLARVIAHAVRQTPGVLEMSPGRFALEATYGPGEHVSGVVLRHPTLDTLSIAIHVVVAETALKAAFDEGALPELAPGSEQRPMLLRLADQIRTVVSEVADSLGPPSLLAIDVALDDVG
jgi:hypothetical protein